LMQKRLLERLSATLWRPKSQAVAVGGGFIPTSSSCRVTWGPIPISNLLLGFGELNYDLWFQVYTFLGWDFDFSNSPRTHCPHFCFLFLSYILLLLLVTTDSLLMGPEWTNTYLGTFTLLRVAFKMFSLTQECEIRSISTHTHYFGPL
jgi:hypothetical protein